VGNLVKIGAIVEIVLFLLILASGIKGRVKNLLCYLYLKERLA